MTTINDIFARPDPTSGHDGWLVLKFGGTSVSSLARWETIRALVDERIAAGYRVLLVHSALNGISDRLEQALRAAVDADHEVILAEIVQRHLDLADALSLDGHSLLGEHFESLEQLLAGVRLVREVSPRVQVNVLAQGELMATRLGAAWLAQGGTPARWVDAREVLVSRELPGDGERSRYLRAVCDDEPDPQLQVRFGALDGVLVTQGFIARNRDGEGVLLGRGGSDTSGAYFAARLGALGLEIWTDVPGMFSADPRHVPGARLLKVLNYRQAQEIASMGGSVLHPRSVRPVQQAGIPLCIRCTARPELSGTSIGVSAGSDAPRVNAIASRTGITVISMETLGMWHEAGFLAEAFRCFSDLGISVDLVSTGETNVTVTLDRRAHEIDAATLSRLRDRLERLCRVEIIENAEIVSLIGQKIRALLHVIGPALEIFEEYRIHLVSQAASDLNLSFVVEEGQAHRLVKKLHATLVNPTENDPVFGPSWQTLQGEDLPSAAPVAPWWVMRRQELLELGAREGSAYVYDLESVRAACERLTSLRNVDRAFYAIKANSHPEILRAVGNSGVSFECVSPGEIARVREVFPDIDADRILFTPNFAPREEYRRALEDGVHVTLDNIYMLRHWADILAGHSVILRLDTGTGRGHHEHVRTAGRQSKFGIPMFELEEAQRLVEAANIQVSGLHAHTGSGILTADNWRDIAETLAEAAQMFPHVRVLDLGGGLGIPEKPGQQPLDMALLDASLADIRARLPGLELWLEPGRYVVAQSGVLLATVTQTKGKEGVVYVGVSTGMNSMIRPALYGAYHEIVNLTRLDEPADQVANIVGPICETGDRLGSDRRLPACQEGDVLLLANAGAYGYVMGSNYNLRGIAPQFTL